MQLTINIPDMKDDLDESQVVTVLRTVADRIDDGTIGDNEMMDGSYKVDTPDGVAFVSHDQD